MTQDTKIIPEKNMSIIIRHAQEKKHKCILCDPDETEEQGQNYYDIEIRTTRRVQAQAIILSLSSMTKGFEGDYNRLTTLRMNLCEIHYRNLSKSLPLNQKIMVDFDDINKLFKAEKLETVQ
jgi:hypothetical protein